MKMYVSKYALSSGIQEVEGSAHYNDSNYFVTPNGFNAYRIGTDAFLTLPEAQEAAEKARVRKIKALENQIAKLQKLSFRT